MFLAPDRSSINGSEEAEAEAVAVGIRIRRPDGRECV